MLGYYSGCWYGQQFHLMCMKIFPASFWIFPLASKHTPDQPGAKGKHCAILYLFAGKIEAYYAAAHAATRIV